jgi:hypothetical protein
MAPLRASDGPAARVMPPSEELFPSGSWEEPWTAGGLQVDYEAGGAYATIEGEGELTVTLDGGDSHGLQIDGAALYELAEHDRHESHHLELMPAGGLRIWSISFAAGVP